MYTEQFDAYKVANDMDVETLQNHFKKVKQIEKKVIIIIKHIKYKKLIYLHFCCYSAALIETKYVKDWRQEIKIL